MIFHIAFGLLKSSVKSISEDFLKPKIVWARLMRMTRRDIDAFPRFCTVPEGFFTVDSLCFFSGCFLDYLISVLNSDYAAYFFFNNVATLDNGGFQMRQQYVESIPIPPYHENVDPFTAFKFSQEERDYIIQYIERRKKEILDSSGAE